MAPASGEPSVSKAYELPERAGLDYAYTEIDAVYIWTRGGYQVARDPDDYPLFLAVDEDEMDAWRAFFDDRDLPVATERQSPQEFEGGVQYVLRGREQVEATVVDSRPVIPLSETVAFIRDNYATFESALEMLEEMYEFNDY